MTTSAGSKIQRIAVLSSNEREQRELEKIDPGVLIKAFEVAKELLYQLEMYSCARSFHISQRPDRDSNPG